MGTNLLTNRLKELEAAGLIARQNSGDKRSPYQLSPRGLEAEAIVLAMIRWGNGILVGESDYSHQDHWDLLAMKALYQPERFRSEGGKVELLSIKVIFKTDDFNGWVKATAKDLSYGLGDSPLKGESSNESKIIELPMTIAQLQKVLEKDGEEKRKLLNENQGLTEFVACFG